MAAVTRRYRLFLAIGLLSLVGCSSDRDKQWYKPNTSYTVAEFTRDREQCTKNRELDEQCMRQRGWVPLTSDREPSTSTKPAPNPRGPRY